MARAKCKRGTTLTERVRLLSPAAEALLLQGGKKSSPLLRQLVEATTCTTTKGDRVVVKATVKRGSLGGANREVVGRAQPRSKRSLPVHRPDFVAPPGPIEVTDSDIVGEGGYDAWNPETWDWGKGGRPRVASKAGPGGPTWAPNGQGQLLGNVELTWSKGGQYYVHFGDQKHQPMQTVSYGSKQEALKAIRESKASGWPARMGTPGD